MFLTYYLYASNMILDGIICAASVSDLIAGAEERNKPVDSFFLCLQVGQRINNQHKSHNSCPIDSYKKSHKPEYWFTIPCDK